MTSYNIVAPAPQKIKNAVLKFKNFQQMLPKIKDKIKNIY